MNSSPHTRTLLPAIALQGAVSTMVGFIGFFIMQANNVHALFRFTAWMLTAAVASTLLAYLLGPRLKLDGRRMMQLGFFMPALLLLFGNRSTGMLALAYGSFIGLTWGARHWLEMSLLKNAERDRYAAQCGTLTVVLGIATTFAATLLLARFAERSEVVYRLYGVICLLGVLACGKGLPDTEPVSVTDPFSILKQREFLACMPLFFLESGLFGITHALSSAGAVKALGSASHFGWVSTVAGLVGGIALYFSRKKRGIDNRAHWLGISCFVVGSAFILLGASAWFPALFVGYLVLKALGGPFLSASEQVLNQRTLDIRGSLSDRIIARECILWMLRMASLFLFWGLAHSLP
ncbi:MAG: hypothetical protein ACO1NO_11070, partial [Burkholderiaceae bacterium]